MGTYLIPNARSTREAAVYVGERLGCTWEHADGGVLFTDPDISDAECAALYAGFVPTAESDETYRPPVPPAVRAAWLDLRSRATAGDPVAQDMVTLLRFINSRLDTP